MKNDMAVWFIPFILATCCLPDDQERHQVNMNIASCTGIAGNSLIF